MAKARGGTQCSVYGCSKRRKSATDGERSNSEGSSDEESGAKRECARTFH